MVDEPTIVHRPVLSGELSGLLDYGAEAVVVDATVGQGGHAVMLAAKLNEKGLLVGLDVDQVSLDAAGGRLADAKCRVELVRGNFGRIDELLAELGLNVVDLILADLGVSSAQLDDPQRGMSFQYDGPLDMRLDDRIEQTAADLVNRLDQESLANLIYRYGEERKSRRIARAIVEARKHKRIERTGELVEIVNKSLRYGGGGRRSRIHPATRTFQALRIAVNDELGQLEKLLGKAPGLLRANGQVAVISFHSLEDRLVKYDFRKNKQNGCYEVQTKKPLVAGQQERLSNPRSRSAKLRVARKVRK